MSDEFDLEELGLGGGKKYPEAFKWVTIGDKVVGEVFEAPEKKPVYEFVGKGKQGEQLFFQNSKRVKQSELVLGLPFEPVPQLVIQVRTKEGKEYTLWVKGKMFKELRAAVQAAGAFRIGSKVAIEFTGVDTARSNEKQYRVQVKN